MELEIIFISFLQIDRAYGAGIASSQVVICESLTPYLSAIRMTVPGRRFDPRRHQRRSWRRLGRTCDNAATAAQRAAKVRQAQPSRDGQ